MPGPNFTGPAVANAMAPNNQPESNIITYIKLFFGALIVLFFVIVAIADIWHDLTRKSSS